MHVDHVSSIGRRRSPGWRPGILVAVSVLSLSLAGHVLADGPRVADAVPAADETSPEGAKPGEDESLRSLASFLRMHCHACHGAEKRKRDLRLDTLGHDLRDVQTASVWQEVLDQLNRGEMPPKKEPRPDVRELEAVIDTLTSALRRAREARRGSSGHTVIRRLNRIELRNTLRDLLYLEGAVFRSPGIAKLEDANGKGSVTRDEGNPTRNFPADEELDGFDTIGEHLVMSGFLLQRMIAAAEECLTLATHTEPEPAVETRRYAGHVRTQGPNPGLESWSREIHPEYDAIYQRYREPGASTGGAGRVTSNKLARTGVGAAARYRISIEVSAHHQTHGWGDLIRSRQDEPMLVGLHICDARRGGLHEGNPTSEKLTEWSVSGDGRRRTLVFESWLDATWTPWIGWENGPYDRALTASKLVERLLPEVFRPRPGKNATDAEKRNYEPDMARALLTAGYLGPHVRIHAPTLEPLIEGWPPRSHVSLYGESDEISIETLFLRFARRAFRREVKPESIGRYVRLVEARLAEGRDRMDALRVSYTAILASPRFLYLVESPSSGPLDDFELASRLSYFLWSSMPDDALLELAAGGRLREPKTLARQVDRLLEDPRAASFVRRFTERWLRLDRLGSMPPENGGPFRIYRDRQLESQMSKQVDAIFGDLVRTNGAIRELIDSDHTFLNERVASILYGRDDVWGDGFRKVALDDPRRGGILTVPAVLTATANGVDTSPVVRGVWVLENILGTPPGPPPPDVEPLSPDLRGARTIRERLEKHREVASCDHCHRKIDPLGFALENFDPIGSWRTHYPDTRRPIDATSTFSGGETVEGIVAFKRVLLEREDQIVRCLAEKLLTHASGRALELDDRDAIDRIVAGSKAEGHRLRDLIHRVVRSEIFLSR